MGDVTVQSGGHFKTTSRAQAYNSYDVPANQASTNHLIGQDAKKISEKAVNQARVGLITLHIFKNWMVFQKLMNNSVRWPPQRTELIG